MEENNYYGLDLHCQSIIDEYRENLPTYSKILDSALAVLKNALDDNGIYVTGVEGRIKQESSLAGKLELKGTKYNSISDITDIVGLRVITFYTDDVDKVSALVDKIFEVDWNESVDKRALHNLDSFGYNSLHYICRIPKSLYKDPQMPLINELRFELQMRTALQHVWATLDHDTGYKSGVEIPREYIRNLNRLAGMLELVDEQFSIIRTSINDYRRCVQALVSDGNFDNVLLDVETFRSYLQLKPFDNLNKKIAAINQAEILDTTAMPFLNFFKAMNFKTLGDIEKLKKTYSEDAYHLAVFQIGNTDLDIISSTVAIQDLCAVKILAEGGGVQGLEFFFDTIYGTNDYNKLRAERLFEQASQLSFMNKL